MLPNPNKQTSRGQYDGNTTSLYQVAERLIFDSVRENSLETTSSV